MKKRLIPMGLLALGLCGGALTASAQTAATASKASPATTTKTVEQKRAARAETLRSQDEISKDLDAARAQLAEKENIANYDTAPLVEKVEQLERELKIARNTARKNAQKQ